MSVATVYRTLASLEEKDVSQHQNFDGGDARFEIVPEVITTTLLIWILEILLNSSRIKSNVYKQK